MKIIVWGINYAPEQTGIAPYNTGLCEHLAAAGHDVRMLTSFAYYPEWRKAPADRGRMFRTDTMRGVAVHRCWHFVPRRPNAWKRMLHEGAFVASSWLRLLTLPGPDVIVVVSPPLLLGAAAWVASRLKGCPYVFHVQDMQPDAAVTLGLLRPGALTRVLYALERIAYRKAAIVSGITPGMLALFTRKGVPAAQQLLFPNWTQSSAPRDQTTTPARGEFRRRLGIDPPTCIALYSGNLGKKQGLDILLDAADQLQRRIDAPPIRIVIAGDGVEKPTLEARVAERGLANVTLLPLQPAEAYRAMIADADVCLVTQQPGSGALFFPSKLLSIVSAGRPVAAVADPAGELERAVHAGGFGWSVAPGDAAGLADLLIDVARDPDGREARGERGRRWVAQFERSTVLNAFERVLRTHFAPQHEAGAAEPEPKGSVAR